MKLLLSILACLIVLSANSQDYQKSYWLNGAISTTESATHYGGSLEANLALDQYVFSLGYDYYNLPTTTQIGNALKRDIYFAPGYQLFLSSKLSMAFRFGAALSFFEAPTYSESGERIKFMRLYLPLKLRAAYDFNKNWGLYSELTYLPEGNTLNRAYLVGKLGLRFGRLMKPGAKALPKPDSTEQFLMVGVNAGASPVGFSQGLDCMYGYKFLYAKVGYLGNALVKNEDDLDVFTFSYGLTSRWEKLALRIGLGYGQFYYSKDVYTRGVEVQESFVSGAFIVEPGLAYRFTPALEAQLNMLLAGQAVSFKPFTYASLGLGYRFTW